MREAEKRRERKPGRRRMKREGASEKEKRGRRKRQSEIKGSRSRVMNYLG